LATQGQRLPGAAGAGVQTPDAPIPSLMPWQSAIATPRL